MKIDTKHSYVTYLLLFINITVFAIMALKAGTFEGMTNPYEIYQFGGLTVPSITIGKEYYRLVTAMFIHAGLSHLIFNMLTLYYFGIVIEKMLGHFKYLILYLVSGIAGNLFSLPFQNTLTVSVGASTALFGLLAFFLFAKWYYPGNLEMQNLTKTYVVFILLNLALNFWDSQINIEGHIGGLIGGILVMGIYLSLKQNKTKARPFFAGQFFLWIFLSIVFFGVVINLMR